MNGLKWHSGLGIWIRPGTGDEGIPGEQKLWAPLKLANQVVLDIGGHIGCFAAYARNSKASSIVSVEPHPDNCEMFIFNMSEAKNVRLIQAAVVGTTHEGDTIPLYCTSRNGTATHSIYSFRGRQTIDVPVIDLEMLLEDVMPSVVKIDIEGGEFDLLEDIIELFPNYNVRRIGIELHGMKHEWHQQSRDFAAMLSNVYKPVVAPDISNDDWQGKVFIWEALWD